MSIKNDIKSLIIKEGFTITQVAQKINEKNNTEYSVQNLVKKINNETIRYSEVLEIAEIIGYKIEWIKGSGN
ncbi:LLM class flavin-dependent oxidoreductase [Clostridium botulinum]|uniref:LLM class flavin-dependent oxidoreductase n=1 Tax=Clostridium botulinum TaxID=1491 RepID=UPI001E5C964D|nr:LLM class flavin-dependent oxidoreductase [Clostridium botulinum]MCD3254356.1 LLM class flavin-dependent oxidoreductase [Clostridium botulinum C/D]MCD3279856.1 LLM class flavin-dependent oxidoreductase [Clostridium botulinum C/D]MCD3339587.1 LLM class flavin-dependent oxidoreductase [Clostridium botulinum C/D]MCD3357495.1 LLM class flavin-dependent oxidoreductase [Clostridium botulinum C/D]